MKILVCGGRLFNDMSALIKALQPYKVTAIIHGCAAGADTLGGRYARVRGLPEIRVPPNWEYHNRAAGVIRNKWMLEFCQPDVVVAMPGGKGTKNMIYIAEKAGIPVDIIPPQSDHQDS